MIRLVFISISFIHFVSPQRYPTAAFNNSMAMWNAAASNCGSYANKAESLICCNLGSKYSGSNYFNLLKYGRFATNMTTTCDGIFGPTVDM
jgi:hypothetical protein